MFVSVDHATRSFSSRTSASSRANEEEQRSLAALANLLRGAAAGTLTGFDGAGVATAPSFQTVTGEDAGGRILGPVQSLAWRAVANGSDDVKNPGEVALDVGGVTIPFAPRVPKGGFVVTQTGSTLRVTLTTYCTTSDRTTASVTGDVSISLRN
jgi:hypothetical protein